ncbi:MAG: cysteine desulfurase, partial [Bacteroidetes bacterium SW_10_40_5]
MQVYLDNAATTPLDERVTATMSDIMKNNYGNPSSIHQHGRESRTILEKSRKSIAKLLNVAPGEIFFTSGGTEADNMVIACAIFDQNVQHIITSKIEHHAVLHTVERMESLGMVQASYVNLTDRGHVDLNHLESLLATTQANGEKTLVSLMHANNEIGNLLDLAKVGELCEQYGALFHSDTVQTIGHLPIDIKGSKADFITASGHKFNGPKGIGLIYVNQEV